jgi:hypothetical protein
MRSVVTRVSEAQVNINGSTVGSIGKHDFYEYKEYEYHMDGIRYVSYGMDPGFLWRNKSMPILYNPHNPCESVTADYCKYLLKV